MCSVLYDKFRSGKCLNPDVSDNLQILPTISNSSSSINNCSDITVCNKYDGKTNEFVFVIRNHPFGMVVSPNLPVPTTSMLDFDFVQKLSLPIVDRQYKKFTYNG